MKKLLAVGLSGLLPVLVFAQGLEYNTSEGIGGLIGWFQNLLKLLVPTLIALAVVWFIWNVFMFVIKDGEDKEKAKSSMIWGIVAIAVMVSVWGLVNILTSTFKTGDASAPDSAKKLLELGI